MVIFMKSASVTITVLALGLFICFCWGYLSIDVFWAVQSNLFVCAMIRLAPTPKPFNQLEFFLALKEHAFDPDLWKKN